MPTDIAVANLGLPLLESLRKLITIALVAAAFLFGLMSTIYFSVRGREVTVPAVTGKFVWAGESELESAGLNLRRRATRYSTDVKSDTILDQSPRAGEIVKVGQTIAVVVSRETAKEGEAAATVAEVKDEGESDDQVSESESSVGKASEAATKNTNANTNKEKRSRNLNAKNVANRNAGNVNRAETANINRKTIPNLSGNSNIRSANTNLRNVNAPPLPPRNTNTANINRRTPAAAVIPTPPKAVINPRVP